MTRTREQELVLTACLHREQVLRETPPRSEWDVYFQDDQLEREHGPRFSTGSWFGAQLPHERMRYRRAVEALERNGLLVTWDQHGRRLSHVRLTEAGERRARELAGLAPGDARAEAQPASGPASAS